MDRCQEVSRVSERLERSLSISSDRMDKYNSLISDGKRVAKQGDLQKALEMFKLAHSIHQTPKVEGRIKKIQELLAQNDSDDSDEFVNVNNSGLMLYRELYDKLYSYQRDGVSFLYRLYSENRKGGVLADDMGLGKTIQIISFLSGMYDNELIKHALLVMPTSLISNWVKEFTNWTPGMRVKEFHGASKAERTRNLEKVQRRGGVVITTYTMLMNNWQQLGSYQGQEFCWDYMILDEAHKIKNSSTKTAKSAYAIPSKNRILLSGTPVQNNLREMWTLFDFACQGSLLGTAKTFKSEYENPITRAREKDATPGEKALGSRMSENLMALIEPYYLRRSKSEVQKQQKEQIHTDQPLHDQTHPGAVMPELPQKNEFIVWTYLSAIQEDIYRQFLSLDNIKELLMTTRSPLAELNILKKLCDHPRLLSANAIAQLGLENDHADDETETDCHSIASVSDETLIAESGKLVFLLALLERLGEEGHRTLIFSHYRKVLDILQRILCNRGFKVLRLDGTITQIAEREKLISMFQKDKRYSIFLLTTQVGGVGITLTAADRVVIYDPSWNPTTDSQAADRAYRIGQARNVIIYRLVTCGTVEEKIYRRQVFKDSLIRQNTGDNKNPIRYFSRQELKELFILEDTRSSSTQLQLQALNARHRRTYPKLDEHIAHLHTLEMFGISDHDLMFSNDIIHDEGPESQEEHQYIEGRVQKASELVRAESELQMQLAERMASSTEPAWLRRPQDTSQEKKPRNPKPDPSPPQPNSDYLSRGVVDLDQLASGQMDVHQAQSDEFIDLTAASFTQQEPSHFGPNRHSESEVGLSHMSPLQDIRVSVLHQSNHSATENSRVSAKLEFSHLNFNLQLEDSNDFLDDAETEEEEQKLLSQLQMIGSFDINKSLSESQNRRTVNSCQTLHDDESMNESIVATKRRRAGVIYDSEEEEQQLTTPPKGSFQVLGASTPKSTSSGSPPRLPRRSIGRNVSVVSRRSLIQSIIEDLDVQEEEEEGDREEGGEEEEGREEQEEEENDEGGDVGRMDFSNDKDLQSEEMKGATLNSEEEEESGEKEGREEEEEKENDEEGGDVGRRDFLNDKDLQSEEMKGVTLNSEEEEEVDLIGSAQEELQLEETNPEEVEQVESEVSTEWALAWSDEDTGNSEPELASGETREQCTAESESYESLVRRGKESYSQENLEEALSCFLRAIDIRSGDPDLQFLTIQLYRRLSQR